MKLKSKALMTILMTLTLCITNIVPASPVQAATTYTDNSRGTHGGYDYELWKDYGSTSMTLNDGGTFSCSWSNIGNALFRKGKKFDSTQTYQQMGNISVDYGCQYNPSGNSYLCVYGWTRSPLVEYYIVDSWGSWRPPGATSKGQITVDGGTYDVYQTTRVNQPSIDGNTTFQQYWSVRTSKRTSGTISVSEHFKKWEEKGMQMGKMYEVALTVEGYQSSGTANVYMNDIVIGGSGGGTTPVPTNVPKSRSAFTTIEAEEYNAVNSTSLQEIGTAGNGKGIGYIENGNSTTYNQIDFGNGATSVSAIVATENDTSIQIRSGSATGTLLGTLNVRATGGWNTYKEVSANISTVTGVKDIVLVFSGAVNVDSFKFSGSGGTTPVATKNAFETIQAENYDTNSSSSMQYIDTPAGGDRSGIGYINSGDTVTYNNVDFGLGTTKFTAYVATDVGNVRVELHSGSATGPLLGTLSVNSTGGWNNYRNVSTTVSNISGVNDLVLVFSGPINVDSFIFEGTASPTVTPTVTPVVTPTVTPIPSTKNAFSTIQAEGYDSRSNDSIETFTIGDNNSAIGYIENGFFVTYKNVDFGSGASTIKARVATQNSTSIQVRAGSATGTLLGTISVPSTGDFDTYREVSANITRTTGVKDIVLVFSGAVNVDSFVFSDSTVVTGEPNLLNTYGSLFGKVGTCINHSQLRDTTTLNILKQQYNSITLENEMKPDAILGSSPTLISVQEARNLGYYIPSNYTDTMVPRLNFSTVDSVMKICAENGLSMRAHTLVWHSQTPNWLFRSGYNSGSGYVNTSVMNARLEFYVKSVINHVYNNQYGDVVYAWDVVNEHLHANNSGWAAVYGNGKNVSFVRDAFRFANDALVALNKRDSVKLFYNDYNTYEVSNDIVELVKYINTNGRYCDGVGMQAHLDTGYPTANSFVSTMKKFLDTGVEVQITELDVTNNNASTQANYYYNLFSGILDLKKAGGKITGITLWGMYDGISWRSGQNPLLFSNLTTPKQSYNSVLKAFTDAGFSVGATN